MNVNKIGRYCGWQTAIFEFMMKATNVDENHLGPYEYMKMIKTKSTRVGNIWSTPWVENQEL